MKYMYIHFVLVDRKPKTFVWECRNNKSELPLGCVKWFPSWRQYCFEPVANSIFSGGCLEDIQSFLSYTMGKHKNKSSNLMEDNTDYSNPEVHTPGSDW